MTPLKTYAHINSLGGQTDEITVLQQVDENDYLVDYKGVKCHAIFNRSSANITRTTFIPSSRRTDNEQYAKTRNPR